MIFFYLNIHLSSSKKRNSRNSTRAIYSPWNVSSSQESHQRSYHVSQQQWTKKKKWEKYSQDSILLTPISGYIVLQSRKSTKKEVKEKGDIVSFCKKKKNKGDYDTWLVFNTKWHGGCIVGNSVEIAAGASLPLARDWAGSLSPDKEHTLYTSVQRSFALIGGQKNSLALIGYPRPRVLVVSTVFWQGRKVENLTSEPSSWLPLVEQQPWARPKRSTRRELFLKLEEDNKYTAKRKRGGWQYEK